MISIMKRLAALGLMILTLLLSACGGGDDRPASAGGDARTITVSGAFALFPMMTVWAEQYSAVNPNVRFDVQGGGAGKGMTDVLAGAVDIAMVSREIKPEESRRGAFGVPVTIDAVVPTVNAHNPHLEQLLATGLTPENGAAVWMTGTIATWGQLLNTRGDEAITVYTRSDASGAGEVWARYLGGHVQEELKGTAVNGDPGLAEAVRQDRLGIGYNNIGFAYNLETGQQIDGLRVVPLDLNGDGRISPDEDFYGTKDAIAAAIAARAYPYPPARELYLVTKGAPDPVIADFYRWVLSDGQAFVIRAGYVNLNPEMIAAALALLGD